MGNQLHLSEQVSRAGWGRERAEAGGRVAAEVAFAQWIALWVAACCRPQINLETGYEQGANDLTWSYGTLLSGACAALLSFVCFRPSFYFYFFTLTLNLYRA